MASQKSWALEDEQRLDLWGRRQYKGPQSSAAPEIRLVGVVKGERMVPDAWCVM